MNYLLLDANVIIHLHEMGLWNGFITQNKVYISSIVKSETLYFENSANNYQREPIDLESLVTAGRIFELSADPFEQAQLLSRLNAFPTPPIIHEGEIESLVIINKDTADLLFCTCEGAAIVALAMLRLNEKGVSVEKALENSGMARRSLRFNLREDFFKARITEGLLKILD